ncbi:MAG: HAMP domain-containing histidine kinase [bacterium]|nr:HAMP domain-containing histidine kinase [bacterium]
MNDKLQAKPVSLTDLNGGDPVRISALTRLLAHEIRNPLNALVLNLKLLDKRIDDPTLSDAITASLEQTQRVNAILTNFVDYTSPGRPRFENVNIEQLISELCAFVKPQVECKKLDISITVGDGIACFTTDPNLLNQALLNLLLNAIEATESGDITVFAELDDVAAPTPSLLIGIKDSGPGFDNPSEAFKPFYSTKNGGGGLGLTATTAISSALGGEVHIENTDSGARVFLELPFRDNE